MASSTSPSQTAYYARYKTSNKWKSNREKRLLRALKRQPNNEDQINKALSNMEYRRKTPTTSMWSSSSKKEAMLLKEFTGSAPLACFSSNKKVSGAALMALRNKQPMASMPKGTVDFSLGARLQGARLQGAR